MRHVLVDLGAGGERLDSACRHMTCVYLQKLRPLWREPCRDAMHPRLRMRWMVFACDEKSSKMLPRPINLAAVVVSKTHMPRPTFSATASASSCSRSCLRSNHSKTVPQVS